MPAYDISLWDFLKFTSHVKKDRNGIELFPMKERLEMSRRICDGLFQMNTVYNTAHRDIKLRLVLKSAITICFTPVTSYLCLSKLLKVIYY